MSMNLDEQKTRGRGEKHMAAFRHHRIPNPQRRPATRYEAPVPAPEVLARPCGGPTRLKLELAVRLWDQRFT